jgi:hypothetical protein
MPPPPLLERFCPVTEEEHNKDLAFCTQCRGKRVKKAVLQPIDLIDLTTATPPSCTNSGMQSRSSIS